NECTAKEYNKNIYPGNTLDTMIANKRYRHIFLKINNSESTQKQGENIHLRIP
ncbi:fimbrial protein, partial [Escherichia coli]|nr:fimbrial protein [Escherichia coli]EFN7451489.1 fimbrial protein [Escherichia coli]